MLPLQRSREVCQIVTLEAYPGLTPTLSSIVMHPSYQIP